MRLSQTGSSCPLGSPAQGPGSPFLFWEKAAAPCAARTCHSQGHHLWTERLPWQDGLPLEGAQMGTLNLAFAGGTHGDGGAQGWSPE